MTAQAQSQRGSWTWLLFLFTIASFIETIFWGQVSAFTPLYLPRLGIPLTDVSHWTGILASLAGLVGIPFLPFWGAFADRFSRQPLIVRSFVAHLIAGVISILAGNIWVFVLGRAVMSLALGNSGLMMTTLAEYSPPDRQGLAFSIMNGASPVGAFIGPLVGGPIVDRFGFPTLLMIDVILMLFVVLALSLGYRDKFRGSNRGPILKMALESVTIILKSPRLRILFLALIVLFAGWMLAFTYAAVVITGLHTGQNPGSVVGLILGLGGLAALVISPVLGMLADRKGLWRILFVGIAVETLLWPLPLIWRSTGWFAITWAMINGVASGVFALSFSVLARSTSQDIRGRVMAFSYLPVNVGTVIGPAIGSLITRTSVFNIFPVAALLSLCGLILLVWSYRQVNPSS